MKYLLMVIFILSVTVGITQGKTITINDSIKVIESKGKHFLKFGESFTCGLGEIAHDTIKSICIYYENMQIKIDSLFIIRTKICYMGGADPDESGFAPAIVVRKSYFRNEKYLLIDGREILEKNIIKIIQ